LVGSEDHAAGGRLGAAVAGLHQAAGRTV